MSNRENTSAIVDGVLRLIAGGAFIGSSLLIPGLAIGLEKPFDALMKNLDERARVREIRRVLRYMKRERLISSQRYEHGITITKKGRKRLEKIDFQNLRIQKTGKWDGKWRLVIFDIPERHKVARNSLSLKLKLLGFQPLQRSVWIHPLPCHTEIEAIALHYKVTSYVTYIETSYIDKPDILKKKFSRLINSSQRIVR